MKFKACIALLLAARSASAGFVGSCPSLSDRINRSSLIVVARTKGYPIKGDTDGWFNYQIQVERVLKGEEKRKEFVVRLRFLPGLASTALDRGVGHDARWVIFLDDTKRFDEQYTSLNCQGSIMGVSPITDLSTLAGQPPRAAIKLLLEDLVRYEASEQKMLEKQVHELVDNP